MNANKRTRTYILLAVSALIGLMALLVWPSFVTAVPFTVGQELDRAGRLAHDVGSYRYRTDVVQTTHPTARLENAGRQEESTRMTVEGAVDRASESMNMKLWAPGAGRDGLELKIEGGQAYGRTDPDGEWNEIENPSEIFAPGGDPLGFLSAAENIRRQSGDMGLGSQTDISDLPSYTFDINGLKFAKGIRAQLEAELRRSGELPPGVTFGVARQYVDMKGRGEIWLNEDGLPSRQTIHLEFPPEKGAFDWIEADITTIFSRWETGGVENQIFWAIPRLVDDPSILTDDPLSLLPKPSSLPPIPDDVRILGLTLGFILLLAALILVAVTIRILRWTQVYGAVAVVVALSLVVTPLLQANRSLAFTENQRDHQAEYERQRSEQQQLRELEDDLSGRDFNPHVDPQADSREGPPVELLSDSLQPTSQSLVGGVDLPPIGVPQIMRH